MSIDKLGGYDSARQLQAAEASRAAAAERKTTPKPAAADQGGASDGVSFSDEARQLAAARQAVASAPDLREEKVSAIKQSIADGTYSVSPDVLARKMIADLTQG